ncbi:DUF2499 domain containing protein [Nitzschia inconspicua]|uniref:DUF2499 domain containing protein n=1 Tax=Nitzschia inconspicua TaxID=303405 RepID=A0A9K3KW84_9STRA|nr:DUF2499 domain containing protein [Nitzschia inconspicua]
MMIRSLTIIGFLAGASAFSPSPSLVVGRTEAAVARGTTTSITRNLVVSPDDLTSMVDLSTSAMQQLPVLDTSSILTSFTDQGQNLAGIFFQASLLPYLLFLYFLSFRANRIPEVANFGFQFILLFVISTIPAGIISKVVYETSLANVDYLHGGAELLLTVANIMIVWGLKEASTSPSAPSLGLPRALSLVTFGLFAATCALGPNVFGAETHSAFLFGIGDLSPSMTLDLPWVSHSEPVNALTIPTWMIHFSSVIEYLVAMDLVWKFSRVTQNEKWKGLTWGMLPLHASGICACTYHLFYNPSSLQFLVSMQAGLTLLGNITCMIAAFRIAQSNGWNFDEVNPLPRSNSDPRGLVADGIAATPLTLVEPTESNQVLVAKVVGLTVGLSYLIKYGSLGIDLPFEPNAAIALAMVIGIPGITAYRYYKESSFDGEGNKELFSFGDTSLSMTDVKKYGVSGTVAYVLTELAFWIVAFPVAAFALYQSTGHWPDVINETGDRAAVLAFVFAGANVARAFVPLRLGAALALAPWVDENLLGGKNGDDGEPQTEV